MYNKNQLKTEVVEIQLFSITNNEMLSKQWGT